MSEQPEAPRRRRRTPSAPPPSQGSVIKGGILVALAVIVGFVLLRDDPVTVTSEVGSDRGSQIDNNDTDDGTDPDGDQGGNDDGETDDGTNDLPDPRDPSEVKVLVANGSGVSGAAGRFTETLTSQNYVTGNPTNTDDADVVAESMVYFTDGYEAEAHAVASAIGASGSAVASLPTPAPVADTQLSHVIVVLGVDLAEG